MLDTAFRQLRYGTALLTSRRIRIPDLHAIIRDTLASRAEYGELGSDEQMQ